VIAGPEGFAKVAMCGWMEAVSNSVLGAPTTGQGEPEEGKNRNVTALGPSYSPTSGAAQNPPGPGAQGRCERWRGSRCLAWRWGDWLLV